MSRQYELVLFGASGYTGKMCARYVATHLPTDLKWALAGRSASKLQAVADEIRGLNADRNAPAIETCSLDAVELGGLAPRTRLLVNCVGPYSVYGEVVLAACVEHGTSYVDTTGEAPWVLRMIRKYDTKARQRGAVVIPQCGFESAASDALVYEAVATLRRQLKAGASHVTGTTHSIKAGASGGTLSTIFAAFDVFPTHELLESMRPFALSPIPHPERKKAPRSLGASLTATFSDPVLGAQATGPMGGANAAIVQRTWGLLDAGQYYGPRFTYAEYLTVRNRLVGLLLNVGIAVGIAMIALPPMRWLLRRLVTQPGSGPSTEAAAKHHCELRAVALADDESGRKAQSRLRWDGGLYEVTAVFMMEAAITILRDKTRANEIGGGILTPMCLGDAYLDRLRKAGVAVDGKLV